MSLRVSGKHMEIGETFRTRIEDRIGDAVTKYFDGGFSGQVTVEKSGSRFSTDCLVHLDTGASLQATGEAQEPQASFDAAAERVYNFLHCLAIECQMMARACGKTNVHSLEPEDLAALTMEASALAMVPLAGSQYTVGRPDMTRY